MCANCSSVAGMVPGRFVAPEDAACTPPLHRWIRRATFIARLQQGLFARARSERHRELLEIGHADQYLARLRAFRGADDAKVFEYLHEPHGARMADLELGLQERHRRHLPFDDDLRRLESELVRRTAPVFFYLAYLELDAIVRIVLRPPEFAQSFQLATGDERALHAHRFGRIDRQVEHIAAPEQALGSRHVDDGARIDLRGDRKGDARGDIRFDETGDDVDRRALRGDDEVDAGRPRQLRDAANAGLDARRRHQHEVRQLVDDDDDIRQGFLRKVLIVLFDLAHAGACEAL